mmetsp:Transcript_10051/g.15260  ORF Transcript_10051/g.15260 Transcript_10051/m.15260 type:complete len:224 (+) Transcript_10051:92-763(+)
MHKTQNTRATSSDVQTNLRRLFFCRFLRRLLFWFLFHGFALLRSQNLQQSLLFLGLFSQRSHLVRNQSATSHLFSVVLILDRVLVTLESIVAVLDDRVFDTFSLWQRNQRLLSRANDKQIVLSRSKLMSFGVLDVHNIKRAGMFLQLFNGTDTTNVASRSKHTNAAHAEMTHLQYFAFDKVVFDGVVHINVRVWIRNGASIVSDNEWDTARAQRFLFHLQQLP